MTTWRRPAATLFTIVVVLLLWHLASAENLLNAIIFPSPLEVLRSLVGIVTVDREYKSVGASVLRVIKGIFVSTLIGLPLGVLFSYYRNFFGYIRWLVELIRAIPPAIVLPIFFFASAQSGADNEWTRIRLVVFGCLPILLMQITETALRIPIQRIEFAKLIGANPWFIVRQVLFFELLPSVFVALRTSVSFAIIIVVVTEMIYPPTLGIGARILEWQLDSHIDYVYAYALIAGMGGLAINKALLLLEDRVIYWKA